MEASIASDSSLVLFLGGPTLATAPLHFGEPLLLTALVLLLIAALSAVNGANDVSKGVATLAGSGVTKYRTAVIWGAATTLAGCLLSGFYAERMLKLFTAGIVTAPPTSEFAIAVICGAAGWVAIATLTRLPVSTTHAIIGSLLGAGVLFSSASVAWSSVAARLVVPLLLSIAVSYALSATLNRVFHSTTATPSEADCLCVGVEQLDTGVGTIPQVAVTADSAEACSRKSGVLRFGVDRLHWASSGAVGLARGLNDAPKLVALGVAVTGESIGLFGLLFLVSGSMLAGGLIGGGRVAKILAEKVVTMNHREGFLANLTTAALVGAGANLGLPMSTTHVSTGAIAGIAGSETGRLNRRTLRDLVLAWTVTPIVAGLISALVFLAARSS